MEIKRSFLIQLVAEEVQNALREFSHGDGETKKKSKGKRPETKDASDEPSKKRGPGRPKGSKNKDAPPPGDSAADAAEDPVQDPVAMGDGEYGMDDEDDTELPGDEEMAADNADADADEMDAIDPEGDAGTEEDVDSPVNDQVAGRTVESITLEPESQLLPGAREIVLTFGDSPDVLRILVDDVGNIVFNLNGQNHDIP